MKFKNLMENTVLQIQFSTRIKSDPFLELSERAKSYLE